MAALVYLFSTVELDLIVSEMAAVDLTSIGLAFFGLILTVMISCLRYHSVLVALGVPVPFRMAANANLLGILGGMFFFQLVGQTLARTVVLAKAGLGGGTVLIANIFERVSAAGSLVLLAASAALYQFGTISFDIGHNPILVSKFGIAFALAFVGMLFSIGLQRISSRLNRLLRSGIVKNVIKVFVYSALGHFSTFFAFVVLAQAVAPDISLSALVAGSLIVMFAASLPISFAGWGVREVSAVYVLGAIGLEADKALAISILVGLISLATVLAMGLAALIWAKPSTKTNSAKLTAPSADRSEQIERDVAFLLPLLTATTIFFQVYLPTSTGSLNVNLADPFAICGGVVFLLRYLQTHSKARQYWRIQNLDLFFILATAVVSFGLLHGFARFGFVDWAFYNRFLGWFVLLGYLGTGALMMWAAPARGGLSTLFRCLIAAGLSVTMLDLVLLVFRNLGGDMSAWLPNFHLTGMAQNANAFAIQATALIIAFIALYGSSSDQKAEGFANPNVAVLVLTILVLAILSSSSRTGIITISVMVVFATGIGWLRARTALLSTVAAVLLYVSPDIAGFVWNGLIEPADISSLQALRQGQEPLFRIQHATSDTARWGTIVGGFQLWISNPFIGAGLGAFVRGELDANRDFITIHNSALWLLTELGVVGFAIFSGGFAIAFYRGWISARHGHPWARALVLLLIAFGLFQMPHDILYQRIFWLLFGVLLFAPPQPKPLNP